MRTGIKLQNDLGVEHADIMNEDFYVCRKTVVASQDVPSACIGFEIRNQTEIKKKPDVAG